MVRAAVGWQNIFVIASGADSDSRWHTPHIFLAWPEDENKFFKNFFTYAPIYMASYHSDWGSSSPA